MLPSQGRSAGCDGVVLEIGIGLVAAACIVPVAFNATSSMSLNLATAVAAIGVAVAAAALPGLWNAAWRGMGLCQRLLLAGLLSTAALVADPGQYVHVVAQALWGLSDGGGVAPVETSFVSMITGR